MWKILFLSGAACLLFSGQVEAICSSYPNTLTNGTTADASQVMANFNCAALTQGATIDSATFTGGATLTSGSSIQASGGTHFAITLNGSGPTYIDADTAVFLRSNGSTTFYTSAIADNTGLFPGSDNSIPSGKSGNRWTAVYAVNGTIQTSDRREKNRIETLNIGALAVIEKLRPVSFYWKEPNDDSMQGQQLGFIAQDVEAVLPQIVFTANDKRKLKSLKYTELIPVLVKAVQELQAVNDNQIAANKRLRLENADIEARLSHVESALKSKVSRQAAVSSTAVR